MNKNSAYINPMVIKCGWMKHARQLALSDSEVFQNTTQLPSPAIKIWHVRKFSIPGIDSSELHETKTGERMNLA